MIQYLVIDIVDPCLCARLVLTKVNERWFSRKLIPDCTVATTLAFEAAASGIEPAETEYPGVPLRQYRTIVRQSAASRPAPASYSVAVKRSRVRAEPCMDECDGHKAFRLMDRISSLL